MQGQILQTFLQVGLPAACQAKTDLMEGDDIPVELEARPEIWFNRPRVACQDFLNKFPASGEPQAGKVQRRIADPGILPVDHTIQFSAFRGTQDMLRAQIAVDQRGLEIKACFPI